MREKRRFREWAVATVGLFEARPHGPQGRGYRLEAFSHRDVPITTLDVGRRFVVVVFRLPPMSGVCPDVGI